MSDNKLSFDPLWADSLGAKTTCTLVKTPEVNILIDPGIAVMQPSFPASWAKKFYWKARGWLSIKKASQKADVVVISHYHYDHFTDFDKTIYDGKLILTKNPNEFINDSQMDRARAFLQSLCNEFGDVELEDLLEERDEKEYGDPMEDIPHAQDKDFGEYNSRRKELIEKWRDRYWKRVENWKSSKWIPELEFTNTNVKFAEGKEFQFGPTKLRFTPPLFHGIELSKTGWVYSTVIERGGKKFIYSSDIQGPTVEDYADWIIEEDPDILYLDGPATYLLGYMLNRTNLNRSIDNAVRIVRNLDSDIFLYDHHLPREKKFRERTGRVWEAGEEGQQKILTVAEHMGKQPAVLR